MFIDLWILFLVVILLLIVSKYVHYYGYKKGYDDGYDDSGVTSELIGSYKLIKSLKDNNIIKFLDDGTFIGFNSNEWNPLTDKKYNSILDKEE
jgi:hypothetical protein